MSNNPHDSKPCRDGYRRGVGNGYTRTLEQEIQVFKEKLFPSITNPGCIECKGQKNQSGYTKVRFRRKHDLAHRVSFFIRNGNFPDPETPLVLHTCHNRSCVNPDHLYQGTPAQNSKDMTSAGRQASGVKCHLSRLDDEKVNYIRRMHSEGITAKQLSSQFGVTVGNIYNIIKKLTWKHLK